MNNNIQLQTPLGDKASKLLDSVLCAAREEYEFCKHAGPIIVVAFKDNQSVVIPIQNFTPEAKPFVKNLLAEIRNDPKVAACAFVIEAWLSVFEGDKDKRLHEQLKNGDPVVILPPKHDLNRIEAVVVQFHEAERTILIRASIHPVNRTLSEWMLAGDSLHDTDYGKVF